MAKWIWLSAVFFVWQPLLINTLTSAQTMEELYANRFSAGKDEKPTEEQIAAYFIHVGYQELAAMRANPNLTEEEKQRKAAIDAAMKPIRELVRFQSASGHIPDDGTAMRKLKTDMTIARNVFDAMGPEAVVHRMQAMTIRLTQMAMEREVLNSSGVITPVLESQLASALGLTEKQCEKIEKLVAETSEQLRIGPGKEFSDLEKLFDDHWKQLLAVLDTAGRRKGKDLVGQPVQWYRSVDKVPFRGFSGGHISYGNSSETAQLLEKKYGKPANQLTAEEVVKDGVEFFYSHYLQLMQSKFVWDELELTNSQRRQIRTEFHNGVPLKVFILNSGGRFRIGQMISGDAELPKYVAENFVDKQQEWFRNFEFQMLTGRHQSSFGLLDPQVIEHLELTENQISEMTKLSDAFEKQRNKLEEKLAAHRDQMKLEFKAKVAKILTDEQRELFKKFTGQSIEGEKLKRVNQ